MISSSFKECYEIIWKNGITYSLKKSDLTNEETDVIVNAANTELWLGGGVAGAIRRKGGDVIQKECNNIIKNDGTIEEGEVKKTGIGLFKNKNLKYIFHAVGPVYRNGNYKESEKLKSAFINCFKLADTNNLTSISIPPISSGIFGYPKKECAKIFYMCLEDYVKQYDKEKNRLTQINMTIIDLETYLDFLEVHKKYTIKFQISFSDNIQYINNFEEKTSKKELKENLDEKYNETEKNIKIQETSNPQEENQENDNNGILQNDN